VPVDDELLNVVAGHRGDLELWARKIPVRWRLFQNFGGFLRNGRRRLVNLGDQLLHGLA
jgi:hypothetical protein